MDFAVKVLGKKIQIREYDEEMLLLELELEDLEVDMDENMTREVEEMEYLRTMEIKRGIVDVFTVTNIVDVFIERRCVCMCRIFFSSSSVCIYASKNC